MTAYAYLPSPLGELLAIDHGRGLAQLSFGEWSTSSEPPPGADDDPATFAPLAEALERYFAGEPVPLDLPVDLAGTGQQQEVWAHLRTIPYGRTTSYGEVARAVGRPTAARAVAAAIGRNPVALVVPCHRVIAANGALTGYAAGLDRKEHLLRLEGVLIR